MRQHVKVSVWHRGLKVSSPATNRTVLVALMSNDSSKIVTITEDFVNTQLGQKFTTASLSNLRMSNWRISSCHQLLIYCLSFNLMFPYFLHHTAETKPSQSSVFLSFCAFKINGSRFSVALHHGVVYDSHNSCAESVPYYSSASPVYVKYLVHTAGLIWRWIMALLHHLNV